MSKKSDDNLDKNSQKQTVHFVYDEKQKFLWIDKYYFNYFLGYATGFPISMVKGGSLKAVKNKPELNFFGLEERQYIEIIQHQKNQYNKILYLGTIPLLISLFLLFTLTPFLKLHFFRFFISFFYGEILNPFGHIFITVVDISITLFFQTVIQLIYFRLLGRIMEYLMPEILCIRQIIDLNLELTRDDVIYRRDVKSMVLFRMDYLARVTMLVPLHYGMGRSGNQKWIEQHFQNISYYIRERRRWLIAPNETTLDDLRRDFRKLAYYYLTGKYGAWEWALVQPD
jgi:hypothetical protein